jgi:NAD(P)H-nitrite reductase large subunit
MHHLIIGAGPAGIVAAEHLRKLDPQADITVIGDEPEPPYSRMALPYYLIDQIQEPGTHLRKHPDHFARQRITLQHARATGVAPEAHQVTLQSGETLRYDKLLIATGSRPVSPPIPGIDAPGVYPCWTLEHARHIMHLAQPGANVVLMGAGFIGCIILEALATRGVNLSVVEMENRMVPRMMNETTGGLIKRWCEAKGVKVYTGTKVEAIEPAGPGKLKSLLNKLKANGNGKQPPLAVKLDDGQTLAADLVISATGVKPNLEFLQGTGIKTDIGVLIDRTLQTSQPDVYAAGDVAQGQDFNTGEYSVQAIQPTAVEHGRLAASNMAGHVQAHRGSVNMNVLDTMGLISSSFGLWMGAEGGDTAELHDPDRYRYLNLQFQDDVLVGASSLGLTQHVGVIRGLIQSKTHLKHWKRHLQQDPTRLMEAYLARQQAIGHNASVLGR